MSVLGIVSDTHDRVALTERAARWLGDQGIELLVHCGDVTSRSTLDSLLSLEVHLHLVFGNMDRNRESFQRPGDTPHLHLHEVTGTIEVDGKDVGFTHGHLDSALRQLKRESLDYLLVGHTHTREDRREGTRRIINPGSVKPPSPSVALLDTHSDTLKFHSLD